MKYKLTYKLIRRAFNHEKKNHQRCPLTKKKKTLYKFPKTRVTSSAHTFFF
jgi:hypothetical protein